MFHSLILNPPLFSLIISIETRGRVKNTISNYEDSQRFEGHDSALKAAFSVACTTFSDSRGRIR